MSGGGEPRPAHPEEIRQLLGADAGSLGPVGVKNMRVIADLALQGRRNMICRRKSERLSPAERHSGRGLSGGVCTTSGRSRQATRISKRGEPLEIHKTVEIGHIFKLGYKYSDSMGLKVTNESGEEVTVIMGSYGIGIERILSAAVELYHDENGMALPASIAPFEVVVTPVNMATRRSEHSAARLAAQARAAGLDMLFDDRDERARRQVQGCRPDRYSVADHRRQKSRAAGVVEVVERRISHDDGSACRRGRGVRSSRGCVATGPEPDWAAVRAQFPALAGVTYLNTATYGQTSRASLEAVQAHFARRDAHACSDFLSWFDDIDRVRGKIARLVNAPSAADIAFCSTASAALSWLCNGLSWRPGDKVIALADEFPNNSYFPATLSRFGVQFIESEWADLRVISIRAMCVQCSSVR